MLNDEYIKKLEDSSKFNIDTEEKTYILNKFNIAIKNWDKLALLPKTEEVFVNNIEDEII